MSINRIVLGACVMLAGIPGAAAADWSGFYAGVLGGVSAGHSDGSYVSPLEGNAGVAGAFAGYSFSAGTILVGPELAVLGTSTTVSGELTSVIQQGTFYLSDTLTRGPALLLNGRAAMPAGPFLLSLSAGVATAEGKYQRVTLDENLDPYPGFTFGGTARHIGFNIGAGVDVQLTERVALGLEARYIDYGAPTYQFDNSGSAALSLTEQMVNLRLTVALD